jgi:hypothetical protein
MSKPPRSKKRRETRVKPDLFDAKNHSYDRFLPGVDLEDSVHQFSHAFSELLHSMMG